MKAGTSVKLYLYGHDYKYAAEQMLLTMFPGERPEYPEGRPAGDRMELRLSRGDKFTTASCKLVLGENEYRAMARADIPTWRRIMGSWW